MDTDAQAEMLFNRLVKRFRHLRKWARREGVEAFRLYDRDIPEIPLTLDWYGGAAAGALYERPYEKDEAEERRWLGAMREAAAGALGIETGEIFLKLRKRQRGASQYERLGNAGVLRDVKEKGLVFRVNLSDYLDTGLFLDARKRRVFLQKEAGGRRVLNLFAYTCSLSAAAAAGGAAQVDSVDLSRTYLEWGKANLALNGFQAAQVALTEPAEFFRKADGKVPFTLIRADALAFIMEAKRRGRRWDLVILDPPAFSNSKRMESDLDLRRDHRDLVGGCLELLAPGGGLLFSSNVRGFRLDTAAFPGCEVRDLTEALRDEDFRGRRVPAAYWIGGHPVGAKKK